MLRPPQPEHALQVSMDLSPIRGVLAPADLNVSRNVSWARSPHKARLNKSAVATVPATSPFVQGLTDNVETQKYIARLEDELVELEAELVWASGPLLEENEQLTGANETLRAKNRELSLHVEEAEAAKDAVAARLAETEKKLGYAVPGAIIVAAALAALVVWAISGMAKKE